MLPSPPPWLLVVAGLGLVATEATLAVTPWVARLRRPGTILTACFHDFALAFASASRLVALRLVFFGGTAVLLHATSAGLVPVASAAAAEDAGPGTVGSADPGLQCAQDPVV